MLQDALQAYAFEKGTTRAHLERMITSTLR